LGVSAFRVALSVMPKRVNLTSVEYNDYGACEGSCESVVQ